MDFKQSETRINLMRAFAGESQARNRYTFAAAQAREKKYYAIEKVFNFTAGQEKEHAEIFYNHLKECAGENIEICGAYPVDIYTSLSEILESGSNNEFEESDDVYPAFEQKAREEGFDSVAVSFNLIAKIEKTHGERFKMFKKLLDEDKLYTSENGEGFMCLNCGHIHTGKNAPDICPVCSHEKGYFIKNYLAPYTLQQ